MLTPAHIASLSYASLALGEIRLLKPTDAANGLGWTLTIHKLTDDLGFDALSYTWGPQDRTFFITCNDRELHVHHNLYSALPFLAALQKKGKSRPIWIDAVCINQQDEEEKMVQIKMMNDIYRSARMVWVWLGIAEKQDRIGEAIATLPKLIEAANQIPEDFEMSPRTEDEAELARVHGAHPWQRKFYLDDSSGLNNLDSDLWTAILHLLSNSWYFRVWVVQELVLARDVVFLCGAHAIDYPLLRDAVCDPPRLAHICDKSGDPVNLYWNSEYVFYAREVYARYTETSSLETDALKLAKIIPWISQHMQCSQDQDRVLGVLGLVSREFLQRADLQHYSSVTSLYTTLSTYIMANVGPTQKTWWQWLSLAFTKERRKGLPSWVPDLHRQGDDDVCRPWPSIMGIQKHGTCPYKASNRIAKVDFGEKKEELVLRGMVLDEVILVHPRFPNVPDQDLDVLGFVRYVAEVIEWERLVSANSIDTNLEYQPTSRDSYWRTLLADITDDEGDSFTYDTYLEFRREYTVIFELFQRYRGLKRYVFAQIVNDWPFTNLIANVLWAVIPLIQRRN